MKSKVTANKDDFISKSNVAAAKEREKLTGKDGMRNSSLQSEEKASPYSRASPKPFDTVNTTSGSVNLTDIPWDNILDEIYPNRLLIGWQCNNDDILNENNTQQRRKVKHSYGNTASNNFFKTGAGEPTEPMDSQRRLQSIQSVAPSTESSSNLSSSHILNCSQLNDPNRSIVMNFTSCDMYSTPHAVATSELHGITLYDSTATFVVFDRLRQLLDKQQMFTQSNTLRNDTSIDSFGTEISSAATTREKLRQTILNWFDEDAIESIRLLYKRKRSHIPFKREKAGQEQLKKQELSKKTGKGGASQLNHASLYSKLPKLNSNLSLPYFETSGQGKTICEIDLIQLKSHNEIKEIRGKFCSNFCDCQKKKKEAALSTKLLSPDILKEMQKLDEEKRGFLQILKSFVAKFSQPHYSENIAFIIPDAPVCLNALRNGSSKHLTNDTDIENSQSQLSKSNFTDLSPAKENALPISQEQISETFEKQYVPSFTNNDFPRYPGEKTAAIAGSTTNERENTLIFSSSRDTKSYSNETMATQQTFLIETTQATESNSKIKPTFSTDSLRISDAMSSPNDPLFNLQWSLRPISSYIESKSSKNCIQTASSETNALSISSSKVEDFCAGITGQSASEYGKNAAPIGIDAVAAWEVERLLSLKEHTRSKQNIVPVAIIDTGVNYFHQDLQESMWINEAELFGEANVDDDDNGYIDDVYGWNFFHGNNNPMDDNGHGTHISGIVAARRDNREGISGLCSSSRIMALKILNHNGEGDISKAIPAIQYALDNGARIITNSWGGIPGSNSRLLGTLLQQIIDVSSPSVFVVAAGNDGLDITSKPYYPASLLRDWTVTVGAYAMNGSIPVWSNYGNDNVHFTAPGENITSLWLNQHYRLSSGTSMAAPMASGVACLILSRKPTLHSQQVVDALLETVTPVPAHKGSSISSGRLNAYQALRFSDFHFFSLSNDAFSLKKPVMDPIESALPNLPTSFNNNEQDFNMQSIVVDVQADDLLVGWYYGYVELSYVKAAESYANVEHVTVVQIRIPINLSITA
ncbi:subtilisin SUB8 [Cardiosporidium cionae]|uniref:subtilisin n=1 Tax=Cardiosporidium cionae TaxID=476202 RepID=A0ABQ7JF08_9APIC|nr:subtilisin SUB8 [Cardiosporidium cionae]|eukprot:KAF8822464.1 subtilisin SUB8 [Cardiosporidium cionae]